MCDAWIWTKGVDCQREGGYWAERDKEGKFGTTVIA